MRPILSIMIFFLTCTISVLGAQASSLNARALLVASHEPGAGQSELRFAAKDTERMREALVEVGRVPAEHVTTLVDPDAKSFWSALQEQGRILGAASRSGEQTVFFFYYSGHARSKALNLGDQEIELEALRDSLDALPAAVKIVMLDACQAGSISKVKGVEPAADFSSNSVDLLRNEGLVILASSSGSELSQESEDIGGSYFTHNMVTGMRGAADANRDGRVTLSESYDYAYNRTLADTAATQVGSQHVTGEFNLKGKGDLVVAWPGQADSHLDVPASLDGRIVVTHRASGTVVAEVHKASSDSLTLALSPGNYDAVVRQTDRAGQSVLYECGLALERGGKVALEIDECSRRRVRESTPKGDFGGRSAGRFGLEFRFGYFIEGSSMGAEDRYAQTLNRFGFERDMFDELDSMFYVGLAAKWRFKPHMSLVLEFSPLERMEYVAEDAGQDDYEPGEDIHFSWKTYRLGLYLRGHFDLFRGWVEVHGQVGGGLGFGVTKYDDASTAGDAFVERHWGYHLAAGAGISLVPWRHLGFHLIEAQGIWAPIIDNEFGDTHHSAGLVVTSGVFITF